MLDFLIRGGRIVDGSGNPWFKADVAVRDGVIVDVRSGIEGEAKEAVDARGKVVIPGIIDIHSHTDRTLWKHPAAETAVRQGITTQAIGTCGSSPAPAEQDPEQGKWPDFASFFAHLRSRGTGINVVSFVGHGTVRARAMGAENEGGERPVPTGEALERMCTLVGQAMREGCRGVTTGLQYSPGRNANTAEIIALMGAAAPGVYMTHMRNQQDGIRDSVAETLAIAREAGCRAVISHLKMPRRQWGLSGSILGMLEAARAEGLDVLCDAYPWEYSGIGLLHRKVLPPWVYADGIGPMMERLRSSEIRDRIQADIDRGIPGWTNSVKVRGWGNHTVTYSLKEELQGQSISRIAKETGRRPLDAACDIILHDGGVTRCCGNTMHEEDIRRILAHPLTMVSTDSKALDGMPTEPVHPRGMGTYPRLFGHYVREEGVLTLEEAVRKCTSMPASALGLADRGLIKADLQADLVVMDPEEVHYPGSYGDPLHFPRGIDLTMVAGKAVFRDGGLTGELPGRVL